MSDTAGDWCLIESDPGVFTELIRGFGVKGVQVEEIVSLDDDSFKMLRPVLGLIFLFKWDPNVCSSKGESVVTDSRMETIFFAKQVIRNACATQAIINILMNIKNSNIELGKTMCDLVEFTRDLDPETKGLAIGNCETVKSVHNSFSRQTFFEFDQKSPKTPEDNYHFIAYVPINGRLYELDGLKEGPIDHGKIESEDWIETAKPVLLERIQRYFAGEIHFNLQALVTSRKDHYQNMILTNNYGDLTMDHIEIMIDQEELKMRRYCVENQRRKHNYMPFVVELFKVLAREGSLCSMYKRAKERTKKQLHDDSQTKTGC